MSYSCIVQIDNSGNNFPLKLVKRDTDGTFNPSLPSIIDAYASVTLTLTPNNIDAAATLVWKTGPSGVEATITMSFKNGGHAGIDNSANLTVTGDYHPPANLCPGEVFLATIYNALTGYKDWDTTLLIVTFDEHGGNFDHVPPLKTVPPDEMTDSSGFGFDRLGVRVPTLLISPTIPAGTVFRSPNSEIPFDHTSFIKTILGWKNINIGGGVMGARAAQAPNFSGVIVPTPPDSQPVNPGAVTVTPNSACSGIENPLDPPADTALNGLQKFLLPFVAETVSGSKRGTDEHRRVLPECSR